MMASPDPTYRLERPLALGGMATVHLAVHKLNGEQAVIKQIRPELLGDWRVTQRFDREARILCALEHPNIVRLRTWGVTRSGGRYLVLDYVEGKTLHDVVDDRGPMRPDQLFHVANDIVAALQAAHAAGVVHRDLKPENVMLTSAPRTGLFDRAMLLDFGIARRRGVTAIEEPQITGDNVVMGTPDYMSPEQAAAEEVDHRSDLYSLGCMLHFMATGAPPFESANALELLTAQLSQRPDLTRLSATAEERFVRLVFDLLAKRPDDRPADAAAVLERLAEAQSVRLQQSAPKRRRLLAQVQSALHGKPTEAATAGGGKRGGLGRLGKLLRRD